MDDGGSGLGGRWKAKGVEFRPGRVWIMGVLNVTPDSFFDGGRYDHWDAAVDRGIALAEQGADIIDIGGESTRPGAPAVDGDEELRRVLPVVEGLRECVEVPLSIDTTKPEVAAAAVRAGAAIVNDIGANRADPELWRVVAETGAGYVLMHMQGTPQTMQQAPRYEDVVSEVGAFFEARLEALERAGVPRDRVALDPGIGFGKNVDDNLKLLANLNRFKRLERPLLLGVSRKSFIGKLTGATVTDRLPGSLACAVWGVRNGMDIVRVHDVAETRQALRVAAAILAAHGGTG